MSHRRHIIGIKQLSKREKELFCTTMQTAMKAYERQMLIERVRQGLHRRRLLSIHSLKHHAR